MFIKFPRRVIVKLSSITVRKECVFLSRLTPIKWNLYLAVPPPYPIGVWRRDHRVKKRESTLSFFFGIMLSHKEYDLNI